MKKILLKGGEVVSSEGVEMLDVLIEGKKILAVGEGLEGDEVVDCSGKVILPGLIDVHVHFRTPGHEYKEDWDSGSRAAVAGGVTTVCDMPNNKPPIFTVANLEAKRELIAGKTFVNYGLYMGSDGENVDELVKAERVPGVKVYICDSTGDLGVGEGALEKVFAGMDKLVVVHAEDPKILKENTAKYLAEFEGREVDPAVHSKIRSAEAARSAVEYACGLAKKYGKRLHIAHMSTDVEMEVVNKYREEGVAVTCEVSPHHLMLSTDDYEKFGNYLRVNPPVRDRSDLFAMWKGLKFGEIDMIATDHAPHTIEEKEQSYQQAPSGIPEIEATLPIMMNVVNDEGMSLQEVVKLCCERPAEVFSMTGKGHVKEGYDADLVVVDMDLEKKVVREELFTKCGWSPYEGMPFKGWPVMTFVMGQKIFQDGKIVGEPVGEEVDFG